MAWFTPSESPIASNNSFPPQGTALKITPSKHIKYDSLHIAIRKPEVLTDSKEVA